MNKHLISLIFLTGIAVMILFASSMKLIDNRLDALRSEQHMLANSINQFLYTAETYKMYGCDLSHSVFVAGKYESDGYACVWLEGRSAEEVNMTWGHEYCHHLVFEDYEHFCDEGLRK